MEKLRPGEVVKVISSFSTHDRDLRINLDEGLSGKVVKIDGEGDAQICFPDLAEVRIKARWVLHRDFENLAVMVFPDAEQNREEGQ